MDRYIFTIRCSDEILTHFSLDEEDARDFAELCRLPWPALEGNESQGQIEISFAQLKKIS